ncbi:pumilio-family RNA binding repeat containing protein [Aphelenchoides avenae]|nr:pumilio-family RNA binding repeat containing protein [Aphelenchus avenae]
MSTNPRDQRDEHQCWPMSAAAFYAAHPPPMPYFNQLLGGMMQSPPYYYNAASFFEWPQSSHPMLPAACPPAPLQSTSNFPNYVMPPAMVCDHGTASCQQSSLVVSHNEAACAHCKTTPYVVAKTLNDIVTMRPEEFVEHLKDRKACNFLIQHFPKSAPLRSALNALLLNPDVLIPLSMDSRGNYFVQKVVEEAGLMTRTLFGIFMDSILRLTCSRYGCRVVQKIVECFPIEMVFDIVEKFHGDELTITLDPNACHVVQKVVSVHGPEVFEPFVVAYTETIQNFDHVVLNKYGCHVIQRVLEKLIIYVSGNINTCNSLAVKLLLEVTERIREKASVYATAEFANYVVQFVVGTPSLGWHARDILERVIVPNAYALAMDKFGSNVMEKALKAASPERFSAICQKLFDGPQKDTAIVLQEDPLNELMFHKYGNYVVQVVLEESSLIVRGMKVGDSKWFYHLEKRIRKAQERLTGYSSGKRLLHILAVTRRKYNIGRRIVEKGINLSE